MWMPATCRERGAAPLPAGTFSREVFSMPTPLLTETATVIEWLRHNPNEYQIIRTLAELEHGLLPEAIGYSDADKPTVGRVKAFLDATFFGACSACFAPTLYLPDWRELDWPSFSPHNCPGPVRGFAP